MSAHLAKIGCLIGRHRWMYLISITGDEVIRTCGRCHDPKIADIFPAIKIGPRPGRPPPDPDKKELRTATAMLKAITRNDLGDLACSASMPTP